MNPRTPASRWRRLMKLKLKPKKKTLLRLSLASFFTPPPSLFLATKVAISFVYYSPKTIKYTQKPKIEKKFTGIDQLSERGRAILHIISTTRSCACVHELKRKNYPASLSAHGWALLEPCRTYLTHKCRSLPMLTLVTWKSATMGPNPLGLDSGFL